MKKITLLTTSILALGSIAITAGTHLVQADSLNSNASLQSTVEKTKDSDIAILDKGEFSLISLNSYDYGLNNSGMGIHTGKVVIEYSSEILVDMNEEEVEKYFNLELPSEFDFISSRHDGNDLKSAIIASYKLPLESDFKDFTSADIDTSHEGQINFTLPKTAMISAGQVINIKVQVDFGKILDSLNFGDGFDYSQLIPDATNGVYQFKGVLTSENYLDVFPDGVTVGYADNNQAISKN